VRTAIENKPFATAYNALAELAEKAYDEADITVKAPVLSQSGQEALDILNGLQSNDAASIPPLRQQSIIQKAAQAYITYRNSMELAILKDVKGTKGFAEESESKHKNLLIQAQQEITTSGGTNGTKKYADSLLAMLDYQALQTQNQLSKKQKVQLILRHIRDVFRAFPIDSQYQLKVVEKLNLVGWPVDNSTVKSQL